MANKHFLGAPKVAIVTGATTGLGAATTRLLAANNFKILATAFSDPDEIVEEIKSSGGEIQYCEADLGEPFFAATKIVNAAISHWGRLDLLVNSAATISHKPVVEVTNSDWDTILAVNIKAPFFLAQRAFPYLTKTKGSIINISSTNAWVGFKKNQLYDSTKAAINNLTKGLSLEFRDQGVRVNAIMPGGMRTPLVGEWLKLFLGRDPIESDYQNPAIAEPEQVAQVILALASDELSWINGVELPVDGGYHLG